MGSLIKPFYTIPLPAGSLIKKGIVQWESKGKNKTGKLTSNNRVTCQSEVWVAQYIDENGKVKKVSTKLKDRAAANRVLAKLENEVNLIRNGVASRDDFTRAALGSMPLSEHLEHFKIKMIAGGAGDDHVKKTENLISRFFEETGIESLTQLERSRAEKWVASERLSGERAPRTINSYLIAVKAFSSWCADNNIFSSDPLKKIKKLNEEVGKRKDRRSLTLDELRLLFEAARNRTYRGKNRGEEHELLFRTLVGTGLRSKELSLATPLQFDFERSHFIVQAKNTKNKRPDILPLRPDIASGIKEWIQKNDIKSDERIFHYEVRAISHAFDINCRAAGIPKKLPDGRSIDVHSLRRTFGTMLARAGVPLTTTQRLMRHSTPELTAKLYIDVEPIDMQQAVDKLPAF